MSNVSKKDTKEKQNIAIQMDFESFKALLTMAGFEEGDLKKRFEAIDQIFDLNCFFRGISSPGIKPVTYNLLVRREINIHDFFISQMYHACDGLDVLSLELLYLKMLEQKPFEPESIEKAESIAYMNEVRRNIVQENQIQLTNTGN